jgi:L-aminopeptidase/D-esterase-like protein
MYYILLLKGDLMTKKLILFLAAFALLTAAGLSAQKVEPAKSVAPTDRAGPMNAITDVPGIEVGSYDKNLTGTTVILAPKGAVGGVEVRGAAPGTRETDLMRPTNLVDKVDAIVITGGSAYGLATADGVMLWLEQKKRGWNVGGGNVVPIVGAAVLFDPARFGRAFTDRPTAEFGRLACEAAGPGPVKEGNVGAGAGAIGGGLKGGLGTSSVDLGDGVIVGAIIAVNSLGSTVNLKTGEFYANYMEIGNEFGSLKQPFLSSVETDGALAFKAEVGKNTVIGCVATNVKLTKAQAQKVAEMAQDGIARAVRPAHTQFDGDTIFALGTGVLDLDTLKQQAAWGNTAANVLKLGSAAADAVSRAIVHAMLAAQTVGGVASYHDKYPGAFAK